MYLVYNSMKVVIVDESQKAPYDLKGRFCNILLWLLARAEFIAAGEKGTVRIDYQGGTLRMQFDDITEDRLAKPNSRE